MHICVHACCPYLREQNCVTNPLELKLKKTGVSSHVGAEV